MKIEYASYSDIGGRPVNEDTVMVKAEEGGLCAVLCDGLGGHGGGDRASQRAAEIIVNGWDKAATPETLVRLTDEANREILAMQTPACQMKTTVVALSILDKKFFAHGEGAACYAYAGDSRLYCFQGGTLAWQTRDHSASQIAVLLGQIKEKDIRFHEDRSRIYRALGQKDSPGAEADIRPLHKGLTAFLLCSDGFWEYIYEEEMEETLMRASSPEDWIDRMRSLRHGRVPKDCDNNSAIAVWVEI